jgi:putative hydrolases of HD superfamily
MDDRFKKQIQFIIEIDKIKSIFRKTCIFDGSRKENDAEHSWHFAMLAMILSEYANEPVDVCKVIRMALIHDIPEIDNGDVMVYKKSEADFENERRAAERIFGLLPDDQRDECLSLWAEFEERKTPEARFAAAIDRIEPVMQNYLNDGCAWKENGIKADRVMDTNKHIDAGSHAIWEYAKSMIDECKNKGLI